MDQTALDIAMMLRDMGGYGVAALMWFFWREERKERIRYRDLHEHTLQSIPDMTRAIEDLADDMKGRKR